MKIPKIETRIFALLIALVGLGLCASDCVAKTATGSVPAMKVPVHEDDGLGPSDIYLEADQLVDDKQNNLVSASGHAEARYRGRVIQADLLTHDLKTGITHASGHVVITSPDHRQSFAEDVTLDSDMSAAVAIAFSARLENNVTVAAGAAIRVNEKVLILNHGIYTPCETCRKDGTPKAPTYSISASKILLDHEHQVVYYNNAIIHIWNIPVFYSPIFWHPDPAAERQSGFLVPLITVNNTRGFSVETPYLWVLSPFSDVTLAPQINAEVNPFLKLDYRERFYSGALDLKFGLGYDQKFDSHISFGNETAQSYVLAKGNFKISDHWDWGFGLERVSDGALFQRYGIHDIYADRGIYGADTARLISQIFATREDKNSFFSVAALDYQSLRPVGSDAITQNGQTYYEPRFENAKTFPIVAPLIEMRRGYSFLGGNLEILGSAVALSRSQITDPQIGDSSSGLSGLAPKVNPIVALYDPLGVQPNGPMARNTPLIGQTPLSGLSYTSDDRLSLGFSWRKALVMPSGVRFDPFIEARQDIYNITDARRIMVAPDGTVTDQGPSKQTPVQTVGSLGLDISYPLIRPLGSQGSLILEPLAQLVLSPNLKKNSDIPNEDSVAVEFDDTNLFATNRFSGYDRYEGGGRLDLAVKASVDLGDTKSTFLVGKSFRTREEPLFAPLSGLRTTASDWIGYASFQPVSYITIFNRLRLDQAQFTIRREETGINWALNQFTGSLRYNYNVSGLTYQALGTEPDVIYKASIGHVEDIEASGGFRLNKNWSFSLNGSRDLQARLFPKVQTIASYQNECLKLDLLYTHDETFRGYGAKIGASDSLGFRFSFLGLNGGGGANASSAPSR